MAQTVQGKKVQQMIADKETSKPEIQQMLEVKETNKPKMNNQITKFFKKQQ